MVRVDFQITNNLINQNYESKLYRSYILGSAEKINYIDLQSITSKYYAAIKP